jgi:hypothetical protein
LDAAAGALWQATVAVHTTRANVGPWEEVVIDGGQLDTPGDVAALGADLLAVADGSDVVLLQRSGDASFRVRHRLNAWNDAPQAQFGRQLRLDGEGATLLIADTDRHRVLWLDVPTRRVVAQFGDTDKPGAGTLALDGPTVITLCGHRAVVYDSNNQRLVKLMLKP